MYSQKTEVILVDETNNIIGTEEKLKAHKEGLLHRAISILIFNSKGELLLQQRQKTKYHCGGLWSNSVCSHPQPNENSLQAAYRRLKEELGIHCDLKKLFSFLYRAEFDNGLIENEYDDVYIGKYDEEPTPNKEEIMDYKWISLKELKEDILNSPEKYTVWFKIILEKIEELPSEKIKEINFL